MRKRAEYDKDPHKDEEYTLEYITNFMKTT